MGVKIVAAVVCALAGLSMVYGVINETRLDRVPEKTPAEKKERLEHLLQAWHDSKD